MITTEKIVTRKQWTTYGPDCPRGSGYCKEHYDRQYLVKVWRLFGIPVWKWTIDTEDVPVWASAGFACTGSAEWKSKFAEHF